MNADAMPDRCIVNIQGEFPAGSTLKVEICNNGNDASPTWEDITQNVLNGQRYFFTNQTKTAGSWGRAAARQPLARDGFRSVLYCIVRRELPVIRHKETSILAQRAQEQEEQRKARAQEQALRLARRAAAAETAYTNEEALELPALLPTWEETLAAGAQLAAGTCLTKDGQVYRVVQAVTPQAHQPPDGEGMLAVYRPVSPGHAGTGGRPHPVGVRHGLPGRAVFQL